MGSFKKFAGHLRRQWITPLVIALFAAESLWLAITSAYPMAFDENWHFQLIQFYANRLNPIVTRQPANTYHLGALTHSPSLLYHYLLSFVYSFITLFSHSLRVEVIGLRLINVAFAVLSLILIRRILVRLKFPDILANLTLLVFAFTPIFSVLAAQINYDNLVILAASASVLLTLMFIERLRANRFDLWILGGQWCLMLLASLVKFSFPPVMVGILAVEIYYIWRYAQKSGLRAGLLAAWRQLRRWQLAVLIVAGVVGLSLFVWVYGQNLVLYHNPNPPCNQVLSIPACTQYYSWDRNYQLELHRDPKAPLMNIISYSALWAKAVYYQLFAEIIPGGGVVAIAKPFYVFLLALTAAALIGAVLQFKKIIRLHPLMPAVLVIAAVYGLALWGRNFNDYRHLGSLVAVQGRYILPVLLYIYALLALGLWYSLRRPGQLFRLARVVLAAGVVVAFLYFGGFNSYRINVSPSTNWSKANLN